MIFSRLDRISNRRETEEIKNLRKKIYGSSEPSLEKAFETIKQALLDFNTLGKRQNFRFIVNFIYLFQDGYCDSTYHKKLLPFLERHSIEWIDNLDDLNRAMQNNIQISWPIDHHYNKKGYSMLAEAVYNYLKH